MLNKAFKTELGQAGPDRLLRPSSLLGIITDVSAEDMELSGAGVAKLMDRGYLWVVVKTYAEIQRMPFFSEPVQAVSHAGKPRHVLFPRFFTVYDGDGRAIIRSSSVWALMDMEKRCFVFPADAGVCLDGESLEDDIILPPAFLKQECTDSIPFTVPDSFTDINGHLNNARYLDIIEDCLPDTGKGKLKRLNIEYSYEIPAGSSFDLSWRIDGNRRYVSGDSGRQLFRAELEYGEYE